MARKKLLSEGEVRQFMKLANLGPLSENYFTNNPLEEESEEERELHATEDELGAEDHFADEEGDELDALEDDGGDNEALLARVVQAVADELGVEVDVEGADAEGGEEELDVDAELDMGGDEVDLGMDVEDEVPGGRDLYEGKKGGKDWHATGHKKGQKDASDTDEDYTSKREKPGADKRKGAEKRGAEGTKLKHDEPGGRGHKKGDDAYVNERDEMEEGFVDMKSTRRPPTARERGLAKGGYADAERLERRKCEERGWHWGDGECHEPGERGASDPLADLGEGLDQEAIVAEVARRVAARLSATQRKEELAEQLAERIFDRLTSK